MSPEAVERQKPSKSYGLDFEVYKIELTEPEHIREVEELVEQYDGEMPIFLLLEHSYDENFRALGRESTEIPPDKYVQRLTQGKSIEHRQNSPIGAVNLLGPGSIKDYHTYFKEYLRKILDEVEEEEAFTAVENEENYLGRYCDRDGEKVKDAFEPDREMKWREAREKLTP